MNGWLALACLAATVALVVVVVAWIERDTPGLDDLLADDDPAPRDPWADCHHPAGRVCGRCR